MIKLIISDLDQTLLTDDKILTEPTINMIAELKSQGIMFTVATGRAFELAKPYADAIGITLPLILNNGALIKHHESGLIDHQAFLTEPAKRALLNYALDKRLPFTFYTEGAFFSNHGERADFYTHWNETQPTSPINLTITEDFATLMRQEAYKLLIVIEDENEMSEALDKFKGRQDCHITRSQHNFLDVLPAEANKGAAVQKLMQKHHLDATNVLVFGDHDNDVEMLALTPYGVAMPNGSPMAKTAARLIAVDTNNHEGVAKTLKKLREEPWF